MRYQAKAFLVVLVGVLLLSQSGCHRDKDNKAPVPVFSATQPSPEQLTSYRFSAHDSVDPAGSITKYEWDFGDGGSATGASPEHVYAKSGSFKVSLTVTDNDGATAVMSKDISIAGPAVSTRFQGEETLPMPGVVSLTLPSGALPISARVGIWTTAKAETAGDFSVTAEMFTAPLRAVHEIRINTGTAQPERPVQATASIPAELQARLQPDDEPQVFVQVFQAGGEEVLDNFELVSSTHNPDSKTLSVELSPDMFTNRRSSDESWEAIVVVGSTKTKPPGPTGTKGVKHALGNAPGNEVLGHEQPRTWPRLALPGNQDATTGSGLQAFATGLADPTVTSPYNPPEHRGTDYRAADGRQVLSMADGKVSKVGFDQRPAAQARPEKREKRERLGSLRCHRTPGWQ